MVSYAPNIVTLCVDLYDKERQSGRLYHQYTSGAVPFTTLIEAMDRMDRLYDELQFPQKALRPRSFLVDRKKEERAIKRGRMPALPEYERKEKKKMAEFDEVTGQRGTDATFIVRVTYRQNASWQGEVTWVDRQKKERFRSALELVRLLDSAMSEEDK